MDWTQTLTIIVSILVPISGGFIWLIRMNLETRNEIQKDIRSLDSRLSHIEGYLEGYFGNSRRSGGEK